ncbi:NAD(P)-dependent oxidoreductase [Oceanobacillus halotolerans]|uniref:NAD(P)-dependent oxidoreductase n=1 Tax=Oceanobacillus halotolerans TaxID=2663380 RepID=UPI0013DB8140|nr:NAD(P)-dependent oxidoreductase [Oceanobacillus halotolerans]
MNVMVENCYQWIGFHLVNQLLEESHHVYGIGKRDTDKEEFLAMFFARNDLFTPVTVERGLDEDMRITVKEMDQRIVIIDQIARHEQNVTFPLLFGEWMSMDENGIYNKGEYIPFDSNYFKEEAVYIKDFCKELLEWIQIHYKPDTILVKSARARSDNGVTLENSIYLRDNRPIDEQIKIVRDHYKRYQPFY